MRVLVLSFYYPPDLCAGSFRIGAIVDEMTRQGIEVDVMTTKPNRYNQYQVDAPTYEEKNNLRIYRFEVSKHESGMKDQIFSFIDFGAQVLKKSNHKGYDLIFSTSSRLFTGLLGSFISRKVKAPFYLDIRDLFVDNMKEILPSKLQKGFHLFGKSLEKFTFSRASKINLVSKGFHHYVESRYPKIPLNFFSNGIDQEFLDYDFLGSLSSDKKIITYAGNIGEGQGLHRIIPPLAEYFSGQLYFRIIGDGGKRKILEAALGKSYSDDVEIIKPIPRIELLKFYKETDALFLHLNEYNAFKKVLPSKIFEYAATGKPIWAGLDGYSAQFVRHEIENCEVFKPCDYKQAIKVFNQIQFQYINRDLFKKNYTRNVIVKNMVDEILSIV